MKNEIREVLENSGAIVDSNHFVYKAGTHGSAYIDKERFSQLGAKQLAWLLRQAVGNAVSSGIALMSKNPIGVIGPAYGAIPYALTVAESLEMSLEGQIFFPARTELIIDALGKKVHVIPEKLREAYAGKKFVGIEDIVNNGTTLQELKVLLKSIGAELVAALAIADRGGQTAGSLGIQQYFPLMRINMTQHNARNHHCPLCEAGMPINTMLGKGERWVELFGQPPYAPETDFYKFWA